MPLTLVHSAPTASHDSGDRIVAGGVWSLTHELGDDDDTGAPVVLVVATHLATGLQLTHPAAGVDDWLMSGLALDELKAQAVATLNGLALEEEKDAARAALIMLGLLLPTSAVDQVTWPCACYGYLALAAGRQLVHVDVCQTDLDGKPCYDRVEHRICLAPSPRPCEHPGCTARARTDSPACPHLDCCGRCCVGDPAGN